MGRPPTARMGGRPTTGRERAGHTQPKEARSKKQPQMLVTVKFGNQTFKRMPFNKACDMIYNHVVIERKHCERFVGILNEDQYMVSGVAKFLSNAKPPKNEMWEKPLATLIEAMGTHGAAYSEKPTGRRPSWYTDEQWENYAIRKKLITARHQLSFAIAEYNLVHKAWYDYRSKMGAGAEAGKLFLEITVEILSAVATAGGAGYLARKAAQKLVLGIAEHGAKKIARKAVVAGAVKGVAEGSKAVGMKIRGIEDIDYSKLALKVLLGMFSSASGDLLDKAFLKIFCKAADVTPNWSAVLSPFQYTKRQELLASFFGSRSTQVFIDEAVKKGIKMMSAQEKKTLGTKNGLEKAMEKTTQELIKTHLLDSFKSFLTKRGYLFVKK